MLTWLRVYVAAPVICARVEGLGGDTLHGGRLLQVPLSPLSTQRLQASVPTEGQGPSETGTLETEIHVPRFVSEPSVGWQNDSVRLSSVTCSHPFPFLAGCVLCLIVYEQENGLNVLGKLRLAELVSIILPVKSVYNAPSLTII